MANMSFYFFFALVSFISFIGTPQHDMASHMSHVVSINPLV
jgi:hypothetical protein